MFTSLRPIDRRLTLRLEAFGEIERRGGELGAARRQRVRRRSEPFGERSYFVRLVLHGADELPGGFEHAIEAALQQSELVGITPICADEEIPLLRGGHHLACSPNAPDETRGNGNELRRDDDEQRR